MKTIVNKILKKPIVAGMILGMVLTSAITAGAMTKTVCGELKTQNPLYSAPRGYAWTMGHKKITAKCSATKGGETNSKKVTKNSTGSVETDWVYGPTYASSGTTFKSVHTGYSSSGVYASLQASRSF